MSSVLKTARWLIDTILPPRCPASGEVVDAAGMISPAIWRELAFIEQPACATCGLPFGMDMGGADVLCGQCLATPFAFDRARSAVVYNDASRKLILGFKYGDRLHSIKTFTPWLQRAGAELAAQCDIVVPVPLHRRRLWQRRFNQSALLAQAVAKANGKTCLPAALLRRRHTQPQKGLSRRERHSNVASAFAVNPAHAEQIKGRRILLVDDVFTSGATLNACSRALRANGAAHIDVLTLARVTREDFS